MQIIKCNYRKVGEIFGSSSRPHLTLDIEGEVHPQRRSGFDIGPVLGPMCSIGPVGPVLGPPCGGQGVVVPIWGSAPTSGRPETLGAKLPSIAGKPLFGVANK